MASHDASVDIGATVQRLHDNLAQLPDELRTIILGREYTLLPDTISKALLTPRYTDVVLIGAIDVLPLAVTRFEHFGAALDILTAYGRLLTFAPHLSEFAYSVLRSREFSDECLSQLSGRESEYLLALLRLLHFDHQHYSQLIDLDSVTVFLTHEDVVVRLLSARLLALYFHAADKATGAITQAVTLGERIQGQWEGRTIDYEFLALWEEQRYLGIRKLLDQAARAGSHAPHALPLPSENDRVTSLAGVVLPKPSDRTGIPEARMVETPTSQRNFSHLARALYRSAPVLITGLAGSGKSFFVRQAAARLGKLQDMVTLHINEQSDAKTLIGIYTTGDSPGTFSWQAGVLTKAVLEGRWVLIEDLERAPSEVIGVILPLIERNELVIPGRGQTIRAALGFRILATMRSFVDHRGVEHDNASSILGIRLWNHVHFKSSPADELPMLVNGLYPQLQSYTRTIVNVYSRLLELRSTTKRNQSRSGAVRPIGQRELLAWTARIASLLGSRTDLPPEIEDQIFLSALDCFAGSLPDAPILDEHRACIAQYLDIDPQRRDHLVNDRRTQLVVDDSEVLVGPLRFARGRSSGMAISRSKYFSMNRHSARQVERIAAAVHEQEPILLVGETGTGKTTSVQFLADVLGKKLVPFNLSQQSESGDLLGGFKPVNTRSIMIPLQDEFDYLFKSTFPPKVMIRNQGFLDLLSKCISKQQWMRVCKCWYKAKTMLDEFADKDKAVAYTSSPVLDGQATKKRRTNAAMSSDMQNRWHSFYQSVRDVEARLLSGGDTNIAFSFVEGSIVKAARNGDWILLDEINLASPDTLEALADLFDRKPSITLTEAGNTEAIQAHADFRVFAAMNPATDVGKKDLPLDIRSRFTELYIESPDRDAQSLVEIVQKYLGPNESVLAETVSRLHQEALRMCTDGKLVDGAGQQPHFSLRTLTRVLLFARDISSQCSLRRALHEGFSMSYLTLLDAESERRLSTIIDARFYEKHIKQKNELSRPLRRPENGNDHIQEGRYWLKRGTVEPEDQPHYIITEFVQRNLDKLIRATMTRRFPVLLQGPTSSGKTSMVEYLAKKSGHKFVRINNHEHTDLQEYLGSYMSGRDGKLQFQEGLLVKALREGHWLVLDELNLAPTDVLEALNRLLDDNRELLIPETQEIVRPHPNFMLFATQNPAGLYGGRKQLSRAFRNRFLELHFDDIPVSELHIILERRAQIPPNWSRLIVKVYEELSALRQGAKVFEQKGFATLRDLFRWALRPVETKQQLAEHGYMLLAERCRRTEERDAVKNVLEKVMSNPGPRVVLDAESLYDRTAASAFSNAVVWTKAMKRLYSLALTAIRNNEPVLLIGETGCGKTTVCQVLAEVLGQQLRIVNAHQNTETGDLIGAQRPARDKVALEGNLLQLLQNLDITEVQSALAQSDVHAALSHVDHMQQSPANGYSDQLAAIQQVRTELSILFEWADGSLIQAMKQGDLFLLDEISLADDSVLERLNSVLEPQRSILLAEKGTLDSFVIAAPAFQFFATMNPGGDYGKKELSPALRNRFTEIWVPSLSDEEDLVQVISARLNDDRLARPMLEFALWFSDKFDTSASASVRIRDLLAWADFVNASNSSDERQLALDYMHGAAMVFVDGLGANPAGLVAIAHSHLGRARSECFDELVGILARARLSFDTPATEGVSPNYLGILRETPSNDKVDRLQPVKSNAERVARAMVLPKPILLEGPPGVGKTTLITLIADYAAVPLTRINLSEQTDLMDLFGSDVPVAGDNLATFAWKDAPFLRAMKQGEWVLLDEMNLASQSILEGLNACLDHRGEVFIPELNQTFYRHPDFRLFAAQNPHHQGGGRKGLPASFVNRFTVVYVEQFSAEDLQLLSATLTKDTSGVKELIGAIEDLSSAIDSRRLGALGSPWEVNFRDIRRFIELRDRHDALTALESFDPFLIPLILQRFRTRHDREIAAHSFEARLSQSIPQVLANSDLHHEQTAELYQVGISFLERRLLASPSTCSLYQAYDIRPHLRTLEAVVCCIKQRWPVLLVGPSGCGKTSLIGHLSRVHGAKLEIFALNSDIDSMDLVGGYEQQDLNREVQNLSRRTNTYLHTLFINGLTTKTRFPAVWLEALALTNDLMTSTGTALATQLTNLRKILANAIAAERSDASGFIEAIDGILLRFHLDSRARFEWLDGTLIRAMQEGSWLVLDNANLCNPAALDRLNSLLEPNGTMIVNEHTDANGQARIVKPHPDFRVFLTMDPKHGELSRALRNRCVELFMDTPTQYSIDVLEHNDSRMTRLKRLSWFGQQQNESGVETRADHVVDHSMPGDLDCIPNLLQEINNGLYDIDHTTAGSLTRSFEGLSVSSTTMDDFHGVKGLLPLYPLLNYGVSTALIRRNLTSSAWTPESLSRFIRARDIAKMQEALVTAAQSYRPGTDMPLIVRSSANATKEGVYTALARFADFFSYLMSNWSAFTTISWERAVLLWWDLHDAASQRDASSLTMALKSMIIEDTALLRADTAPAEARNDLELTLKALRPADDTASPRVMHEMWKLLHPWAASSLDGHNLVIATEKLLSEIGDSISGANIALDDAVQLRENVLRAFREALLEAKSDSQVLVQLQNRLRNIASAEREQVARTSLFVEAAQNLLLLNDISKASGQSIISRPQDVGKLDIIAGTSMVASVHRSSTLSNSNSTVASSGQQRGLQASLADLHAVAAVELLTRGPCGPRSLSSTILSSLHNISSVSIKDLDHLQTELAGIADIFAYHAATLRNDLWQTAKRTLQDLYDEISADLQLHSTTSISGAMSAVSDFLGRHGNSNIEHESFACAWVAFFVSLINMYLSSLPYDPALVEILRNDTHRKHEATLKSRLDQAKDFQQYLTLTTSSEMIRRQESDLADLRKALPQAPQVWRDQSKDGSVIQSQLALLKANMVIFGAVDWSDLSSVADALLNPQALRNRTQIKSRFTAGLRDYQDLTQPLSCFLSGLEIGYWFIKHLLNARENSTKDTMTRQTIPLAGALPESLRHDSFSQNIGVLSNGERPVHAVDMLRLFESVTYNSIDMSTELLSQLLSRAYDQWAATLKREQVETAAKSSLYRYRGDVDVETEADEEDFQSLFPENADGDTASAPQRGANMQILAPDLSLAVSKLLAGRTDLSKIVLEALDLWSQEESILQGHTMLTSSDSLSPMVTRQVDRTLRNIHEAGASSKSFNIYTDPSIKEVGTLASLVRKVEARFRVIQKAWPEHATLADVLRIGEELTGFAHTTPLVKIITKLEKLHDAIHEWQTVASKEFSAAECYDAVTNLIVSWRKLELSTWSRMLDEEAVKCEHDARAWFFLAYESIVAATQQIERDEMAVKAHTTQLIKTLDAFLRSTGLGQFSARLQILIDLRTIISRHEEEAMAFVAAALGNLISFMKPFEGPIRAAIASGRAPLDKDMKNVILMASWKDTNILALKQSAKNSHLKLFKVIRKFRAVLAKPVEPIILQGFTQCAPPVVRFGPIAVSSTKSHETQAAQVLPAIFEELPARLRNVDSTVKLMRTLGQIPASCLTVSEHVSAWANDIRATADTLRKATPSLMTVENKPIAQHLKTRKRALFADVLKTLRTMGFKSNLSSDLLGQQDSLAKVLSAGGEATDSLVGMDRKLHELLHLMPQIRDASRQHSEDLSGAEVGRSVALIESMLSTVVSKRSVVLTSHQRFSSIQRSVASLVRLCEADQVHTRSSKFVTWSIEVQHTLGVSAGVLEAAIELVEAHFSLMKHDGSTILKQLQGSVTSLIQARNDMEKAPQLGGQCISEARRSLSMSAAERFESVKVDIRSICTENPVLEPILEQVVVWMDVPHAPKLGDIEDSPVGQIHQSIIDFVDSILAAQQSLPKMLSQLPSSEDDIVFVVKEFKTLESVTKLYIHEQFQEAADKISNAMQALYSTDFNIARQLLSSMLPILHQYLQTSEGFVERCTKMHHEVSIMAVQLSKLFVTIARDGFCSPKEKDTEGEAEDSKVEGGTGLGEGEGAEDISKDIGDDEDLTELAQEKDEQRQDGEEIEDEKDAVDMADADLEGEMGEGESKEDDEGNESGEDEEEDIDEEAGSVDDLGNNTVDEKMWDDGGKEEAEKDQTADKADGTQDKSELAAAGDDKETKGEQNGEGDEAEEEMTGAEENEEDEGAEKGEAERADPTLQDQDNLELPDDIDVDGQQDDKDIDDDLDMDEDEADGTEEQDGKDTGAAPEELPVEPEAEIEEDLIDEVSEQGDTKPTDEAGQDAEEGAPSDDEEPDDNVLQDNRPDDSTAADQTAPSESHGLGVEEDQPQDEDRAQDNKGAAERQQGAAQDSEELQQSSGAVGERGETEQDQQIEADADQAKDEDPSTEPFRKLGDALEEWFKNRQQIRDAQSREQQSQAQSRNTDVDMRDVEFEHLQDEDELADTQALGAAKEEEARAIDENAGTAVNEQERKDQFVDEQDQHGEDEDVEMQDHDAEALEQVDDQERSEDSGPKAFVGQADNAPDPTNSPDRAMSESPEPDADITRLDQQLAITDLTSSAQSPSTADAAILWAAHETRTRTLSLQLQEQLRLILSPTQTSKLRGDFRTGKRLNIKRIIPYIASNYKRDKIWLRRSAPSKRAYQIMLAVDDSRSMLPSSDIPTSTPVSVPTDAADSLSAGSMALDTLALISRALTMLEAGDLSVVGFGTELKTPVGFGAPVDGAEVVRQLRFDQNATDVKALLAQARDMFDTAASTRRGGSAGGAAGTQVWQLMLILGDGVFDDAEGVRREERMLRDKGVMAVFVIVDALAGEGGRQSITDLQTAQFVKDEDGRTDLVTKRYLDSFPFRYYLIVRDVAELPGVLASALRQWFTEVVEAA